MKDENIMGDTSVLKFENHSLRTLQANTRMFLISSCCLGAPCKALAVSGHSFFQQPFQALDSLLLDSVMFTLQSAILYDFGFH
jgi:hypothetical protein